MAMSLDEFIALVRKDAHENGEIPDYSEIMVTTAANDQVVEANRELLLLRSNVGIAKYGVTLARSRLSLTALHRHALEEALDFANYLQAADAEMREVLAAFTAILDATDTYHHDDLTELATARNACINMLRKHGDGYRPAHHPV